MLKQDIKPGYVYRGKSGADRIVLDEPGMIAWVNQFDRDVISYRPADNPGARRKDMTRASFAAWARECLGLASELGRKTEDQSA